MNNTLKRILISAVSALLCVSMVACGNQNADDKTSDTTTSGNDVVTTTPAEQTTTTPAPETEPPVAIVEPQVEANTMGENLWNVFLTTMQEKPETTAEEMANLLITNEAIQFMGGAMPVEVGQEFFQGFEEYVITGYEKGACFMPMISSIAFVGYIFELPADADVDAFIKTLSDNAAPNWNRCVVADQTVIGAYENTVFFLMCPYSLG